MPISDDLEQNKAICILPWIAIHQKNDKVNSCCIQQSYPDVSEVKFQMLAGVRHESCRTCYSIEDRGLVSQRQKMTLEWSDRLGITSISEFDNLIEIKSVDSRLDNTCNAMCRSCHPAASNLIAKEYVELKLVDTVEDQKTAHIDNKYIMSADRLYFAGGEPLINKEFVNTLDAIISLNRTGVELLVNTNASVIDKDVYSRLQMFSNLTTIVSIDGTEELQTYIRWPIKWNKFKHNVQKLSEISKTLVFNTVVSIYNISNLYDIIEWTSRNYPSAVLYFSILERPEILQVENYPDTKKVISNLEKIKTLDVYKENATVYNVVNKLIDVFENTVERTHLLSEFFKFNDLLDKSRNVDLADYIPDLEECRKYIK